MKYILTIIAFSQVIFITIASAQAYTYASEGFESAVWGVPATSYAAATGTWSTSGSTVVSSPTSPNTTNGGTKCLSMPSGQYLTSPVLNNGAAVLTFYARSTSTTARTITILTSTDGTTFTSFATANSAASSVNYVLITITVNNATIKNIRISYPAGGGGAIDDVNITAPGPLTYYNAQNTDITNLSNWWSNPDGATGSHPSNFTSTNQTFSISHSGATMSTAWTVSSIVLTGTNTLSIGANVLKINGSVSGSGTFTSGSSSSLIISGAAGTLNFTTGAQQLKDLTLTSGATATIGTPLSITGGSSFGTVTVSSGATLTTSGNLTLKSAIDGSARVAQGTGAINGNVTVERFIPANTSRAWRLLSIPVSTVQSFHTSWQENQQAGVAGSNNLGVNITSSHTTWSADGFDFHSNGDGLLTWDGSANNAAGAWAGVSSTANSLTTDNGYMLFIRGDRNATPSNTTISSTTLRMTGILKQGNYPTVPITVPASQYTLIGNPYLSQIDFRNITRSAGITNSFYVWDPKIGGLNGLGGFQTMAFDGTNYLITPGGGSYGINGTAMNTIESGQAFFVQGGTGGTLSFSENAKSTGYNPVFSPAAVTQKLAVNLYTVENTANTLADGVLVLYDNSFSDSVTEEDAQKLANFGINLSIQRSGKALAIEKRLPIVSTDTIFLNTSGLIQQQYQLELITSNLDHPALFGYIRDHYEGTTTLLNLNGPNTYNFTVDGNPGSSATDRFQVIFSPLGSLSLRFTAVRAWLQNRDVFLSWSTENEHDLLYYDVERSINGNSFSKIGTILSGNNTIGNYTWVDANPVSGTNYYRVKSVASNGEIEYSDIIKCIVPQSTPGICVMPNPVSNNQFDLLINLPAGNYTIRMWNSIGEQVYSSQVNHPGGMASYFITPGVLSRGRYIISVSGARSGYWTTRIFY